MTVAQTLSQFFQKKLLKINHIDGHLVSLLLDRSLDDIQLPMVVLSASGGHTSLFHIDTIPHSQAHALGPWWIRPLGLTLDDAAGECFDKVSTML